MIWIITGLFQYLYELDSGEIFDSARYTEGIPAEEFESLMTRYLPVSPEQLREYASYDARSGIYEWIALGVGNRTKSVMDLSEPEVVDIEKMRRHGDADRGCGERRNDG